MILLEPDNTSLGEHGVDRFGGSSMVSSCVLVSDSGLIVAMLRMPYAPSVSQHFFGAKHPKHWSLFDMF